MEDFVPMQGAGSVPAKKNSDSSKMLFVFVLSIFCVELIDILFPLVITDWYDSVGWWAVRHLLWISRACMFLLPAIAIKKKALKVAAIIMISLYIAFIIEEHVRSFIMQLSYM